MIIDIGAGTNSVNFHKGGGKVEDNKAVKYNTKEWWQMLINCHENGKLNLNPSLLYFPYLTTNEFYTDSEMTDFYDGEGNKIEIYTTDGQKIVRHTKFFDNANTSIISFVDDYVDHTTFSDLVNGLPERCEYAMQLAYSINDEAGNVFTKAFLLPLGFYFIEDYSSLQFDKKIAEQKRLPLLLVYNANYKEFSYIDYVSQQNDIFLYDQDKLTIVNFDEISLHPFYLSDNFNINLQNCLGNYVLGEYFYDVEVENKGDYRLPKLFKKINKVVIADNITSLSYMFVNQGYLNEINLEGVNTANISNMSSMFSACYNLKEINLSDFDCENLQKMNYMFERCYYLKKIVLSSKFFNSSSLTTYDFSGATVWTEETSLATLVDALPQLTTTKTIKLSANTKNALTDEQKTTITDKGWTIA